MFEDSTFESTGRIRTRSRAWMIAALAFNSSILLALVLIPLLYPEALPRQAIAFLMEAPAPPPAPVPPAQPTAHPFHGVSEQQDGQFVAPRRIPSGIIIPNSPEPAPVVGIPGGMDSGTGIPGGTGTPFHGQAAPRVVHPEVKAPMHIPSSVEAGLLNQKTLPAYPAIAKAMGAQGTVVLAATISRTGTIENLHVVEGPAVLRDAALDAVKTWRYRPYLLDGQPVEVETTINVIFTMQR
jgi:protein TonB